MPHHMAFCSTCDHSVPAADVGVLARVEERRVVDDPAELVWLEYPARCTGAICPTISITRDADVSRDMRAVEPRQ
jgi:hypothetical protein